MNRHENRKKLSKIISKKLEEQLEGEARFCQVFLFPGTKIARYQTKEIRINSIGICVEWVSDQIEKNPDDRKVFVGVDFDYYPNGVHCSTSLPLEVQELLEIEWLFRQYLTDYQQFLKEESVPEVPKLKRLALLKRHEIIPDLEEETEPKLNAWERNDGKMLTDDFLTERENRVQKTITEMILENTNYPEKNTYYKIYRIKKGDRLSVNHEDVRLIAEVYELDLLEDKRVLLECLLADYGEIQGSEEGTRCKNERD